MCGKILHRLIYSRVLQSAQFYLFKWLFWRTPSTLKIVNQVSPTVLHQEFRSIDTISFCLALIISCDVCGSGVDCIMTDVDWSRCPEVAHVQEC